MNNRLYGYKLQTLAVQDIDAASLSDILCTLYPWQLLGSFFPSITHRGNRKNSKTCRIERIRGNSNSNMAKRSELKIQQQQKVATVVTTTTTTLEQCQQPQQEVITFLLSWLVQKTLYHIVE
jgi:hypothetical protein